MKALKLLLVLLFVSVNLFAQTETFDIISYTPPKKWAKSQKTETVSFSREETGKGFCIITLYRSIDAGADSRNNFNLSWETLVKANLPVGAPQMQPPSADNGWEAQTGFATFTKESINGVALLVASTSGNKLVNILVIMNSDTYEKELTTFLESVKMKPIATKAQPQDTPMAATGPKPEVWMRKYFNSSKGRGFELQYKWIAIYPNGECFPFMPEEGFLDFFSTARYNSWGKKTDLGKEVLLQFNNDTRMKMGKVTATKMSYPTESKTSFYEKCIPVDGLQLEGEWSPEHPQWYNDPKYKSSGYSPIIVFYKDGTFNNRGLYYLYKGKINNPDQEFGRGKYFIKDFTLVLTYDDGVIRKIGISGLLNVNPATNNEIIFLAGMTPYYKNLYRKTAVQSTNASTPNKPKK